MPSFVNADNRIKINNHALRSSDIDETIEMVGHHLWSHRMKIAQASRTVDSQILGHLLGDFSVLDLAYGAAVEIKPEAAPDFYLVHIPVSGYAELHLGGKKLITRNYLDLLAVHAVLCVYGSPITAPEYTNRTQQTGRPFIPADRPRGLYTPYFRIGDAKPISSSIRGVPKSCSMASQTSGWPVRVSRRQRSG